MAMANAMGSTYVSQPDVSRELWAGTPAGNDDEYDEELDRLWSSDGGGAHAEARRQHHQQVAAQLAQDREAAEQMAVDREPPEQQQEAAEKEAGPESPDKAAGSRDPWSKNWQSSTRGRTGGASRRASGVWWGLRFFLLVGYWLTPIFAAVANQGDLAGHSNGDLCIVWTKVPRLGEAENPGPYAAFDDESDVAWSEPDDHLQVGPEQPEYWMPTPTEQELAEDADRCKPGGLSTGVLPAKASPNQSEAAEPAAATELGKWLALHANDSFVSVGVNASRKFPSLMVASPAGFLRPATKALAITETAVDCGRNSRWTWPFIQ